MKTSEMNATQRKAFYNIKYAAFDLLGGLENTLLDYAENDPDYIDAKEQLADHDGLVRTLYEMATSAIYREGFCCFDQGTVKRELREINFCGREWLMERCEARIKKEGY